MTSNRSLKRRLDDLEAQTERPDEVNYEQERTDACNRYERDDYDDGSLHHLWDTYALAYEYEDAYLEAKGATITYFVAPMRKMAFNRTLSTPTTFPPVPTETVAEALEAYGEACGIAVCGLRSHHPETWIARLIKTRYFGQMRLRAMDSPIVWNPNDIVDDISQWRTDLGDSMDDPEVST